QGLGLRLRLNVPRRQPRKAGFAIQELVGTVDQVGNGRTSLPDLEGGGTKIRVTEGRVLLGRGVEGKGPVGGIRIGSERTVNEDQFTGIIPGLQPLSPVPGGKVFSPDDLDNQAGS